MINPPYTKFDGSSLVMAVVSLKHPAFKEEIEWRLITLPDHAPSRHVTKATEVILGIPQIVHKVHMRNDLAAGISGIEIPDIVDRVIIGPTQHGLSIYDAMVSELANAGVEKPHERVFLSNIPLRA